MVCLALGFIQPTLLKHSLGNLGRAKKGGQFLVPLQYDTIISGIT